MSYAFGIAALRYGMVSMWPRNMQVIAPGWAIAWPIHGHMCLLSPPLQAPHIMSHHSVHALRWACVCCHPCRLSQQRQVTCEEPPGQQEQTCSACSHANTWCIHCGPWPLVASAINQAHCRGQQCSMGPRSMLARTTSGSPYTTSSAPAPCCMTSLGAHSRSTMLP